MKMRWGPGTGADLGMVLGHLCRQEAINLGQWFPTGIPTLLQSPTQGTFGSAWTYFNWPLVGKARDAATS